MNEAQVAQIQGWADDGASLSELQRRLDSEFGVKVTYMELRFLVDDLGIVLKPETPPQEETEAGEPESPEADAPDAGASDEGGDGEPGTEPPAEGNVTVTISELVRPGAMVSGRVTFANGKGADWWMDQMGRLGMNGDDPLYRPTEADMMGFQKELQRVAREKGM